MTAVPFNVESGKTSHFNWSMVRLPKEGEYYCGDIHLIKEYGNNTLISVIDGLGHGKGAARAGERAKNLLEVSQEKALIPLLQQCHEKLRTSRGVVMSIALVDSSKNMLKWLGVGNVQAVLFGAGNSSSEIRLRPGIVGYQLPTLRVTSLSISKGDIIVFTTDGVNTQYINEISVSMSPRQVVEHIYSHHLKQTDDALILAARFIK